VAGRLAAQPPADRSPVLAGMTCGGCSLALDFDATSKEPVTRKPTFCAQHVTPPAIFCDDFDAEPLGTKWPKVEVVNGALSNDARAATSAPNSLLSIANPVGVTGRVRAISSVSFPDLTSTKVGLRISFNLRVDQFDNTVGAKTNVFDFIYGPVNDFNQVILVLVSTGSAFSVLLAENPQTVGQPNALTTSTVRFRSGPPWSNGPRSHSTWTSRTRLDRAIPLALALKTRSSSTARCCIR
jgi:hypothetical protein